MIDKAQARFLDYGGFDVRDRRSPNGLRAILPLLLMAVGLSGCAPQQRSGAAEDSLTSGRIAVVCAPEALDLIALETGAFKAAYPQAVIEVRSGSSRDAVSDLYAARCDMAVITRELTPDERAAAVRGGLELEGYRFARDALAVIVNPANPVRNVSVPQLRDIYGGLERSWAGLAGAARPIRPVVQPMESDVTAFFVEKVMQGEPIRARVLTEDSDSSVVARVARDVDAVGFVTLAWANRGARALGVSGLTGLPYARPDAETVYNGRYAMHRFFNLYVRTGGRMLANGLVTFITSRDGQRIVQEAGLVPTSVPVRFVRRSAMLKSH